jgi:hypothetical protein
MSLTHIIDKVTHIHFIENQKKYILDLGPGCEPKPKSIQLHSIHFGIEINKL